MNLAVQAPPLRRVLVLDLDEFKRDREVHEVEVEILNTPETELVLRNLLGTRLFVESVPELRGNDLLLCVKQNSMLTRTKFYLQTSSRFTIPSLIAMARPSPASFSLP